MATSLNRQLRAALVLGVLCITTSFAAEQLSDPTRPAIELVPGLNSDGIQTPPPQGLQSVILSPQREAAIINGTEVELGKKYGDAVLTVVNETCVVLMGPEGRQVMHMFPTVSMTKNQLACIKSQGMRPISQTTSKHVKRNKAKEKIKTKVRAKAKRRAVVCMPVEEIKNGSGK